MKTKTQQTIVYLPVKVLNGNERHSYRNDGVDIESCTDSLTNGFNVGWIEDGEWIAIHYSCK